MANELFVPYSKRNGFDMPWETQNPLWLLKPSEWSQIPPDTILTSILREKKKASEIKDPADDTRFGYSAWGLRESDLNALHQTILAKTIPVAPPAPNPFAQATPKNKAEAADSAPDIAESVVQLYLKTMFYDEIASMNDIPRTIPDESVTLHRLALGRAAEITSLSTKCCSKVINKNARKFAKAIKERFEAFVKESKLDMKECKLHFAPLRAEMKDRKIHLKEGAIFEHPGAESAATSSIKPGKPHLFESEFTICAES